MYRHDLAIFNELKLNAAQKERIFSGTANELFRRQRELHAPASVHFVCSWRFLTISSARSRDSLIALEVHHIGSAALADGANHIGIAEHLAQGRHCADDPDVPGFHGLDPAPPLADRAGNAST